MVAVSVVAATVDPGPELLGLVRSVDAQTLPAADFELIIADASTDGSAERLRELAGRRSNVVLLTAPAGTSEPELVALGKQHASGDHLIVLAQDRRLAPRALELLLERIRESGADAVLGRVVGRAVSGSAQLPDDAGRVDAAAIDPATSISFERWDAAADPLEASRRVAAAMGRYAAAVVAGEPHAARDGTTVSATWRWIDGTLRIAARTSVGRPGLHAWLVLARDTVDIALPAAVAEDGAISAVLDPGSADDGGALDPGLWDLRLRLAWSDGETTLPLPVGPKASAVVSGRPFVVRAGAQGAQLDAGATLGGVTGLAPRATATIVESVHGILLTLDQPTVHVHGDADLDARLLLDGFALRARLVCRDGIARVESLASSLAGVSELRLAVGGGKPVPTGLRLRVDGVGAMTVEALPSAGPKAKRASSEQRSLVQRVRRLAPPALEPVVRRASRVPALRNVYRRLLKR